MTIIEEFKNHIKVGVDIRKKQGLPIMQEETCLSKTENYNKI